MGTQARLLASGVFLAGLIGSSTATVGAGWDFTYGDGGPLDYSEFVEVASTPDGGVLIFGLFSGEFENLDAGVSNRPFAQYRDADGVAQWTTDLGADDSCAQSTQLDFSKVVIDDGGVGYAQLAWCGQDDLIAVDSAGLVAVEPNPDYSSALAAVGSGGVQMLARSDSAPAELVRFDQALQVEWSESVPDEFESLQGLSSVVAADGSGWVAGMIPRPLPQLADAVGLFKVSADGQDTTTVRHFGQDCERALKATADEIWLSCNPERVDGSSLYEILAFDAVNGELRGEVFYPGLNVPFVDEDGNEDSPTLSDLGRAFEAQPFEEPPLRFSTDGSLAFATLNGTTKVWRVTGTLDEATWEFLDVRLDSRSRSVQALDASGDSSVVVVGSTTEDAGPTENLAGPARAFATQRELPGLVSITPARLLDTRAGTATIDDEFAGIGRRRAGQVARVQVAGRAGIPADAIAAVINITAIRPSQAGFMTVFPCDVEQPNASTLNYGGGQVVANGATVKLSASGELCVYSLAETDLAVDVNGYFPVWSAFEGVAPGRLFESRSGSATVDGEQNGQGRRSADQLTRVQVAGRAGVPDNASAAVLNLTAIRPSGDGFMTVFPCDVEQPNASTLNFATGQIVANGATVRLGAQGDICVYSNREIDLAIDVTGFQPEGASFAGVTPARVFDSRPGVATIDGEQSGEGFRSQVPVRVQIAGRAGVPADAPAVVLNITAIRPVAGGFITVFPCAVPQPNASTLNYAAGQVVANGATVKVGESGQVCVFANNDMELAVDVTGYYPA